MFLNGFLITTFHEVDVVARDINAKCAVCRGGPLPRRTGQCTDCSRVMHEHCGMARFFCDDMACIEHTASHERCTWFEALHS